MDLVALQHVGSSQVRDQAGVSCIDRRIPRSHIFLILLIKVFPGLSIGSSQVGSWELDFSYYFVFAFFFLKRFFTFCCYKMFQAHVIFYTLLVGMYYGAATLEDCLAIPQNTKYRVTMWPRNSTPRYIPREMKQPHKNLYPTSFETTLFIIPKNWNSLNVRQLSEQKTNVDYHGISLAIKIKNWHVPQHGWTSKTGE